MATHIMFETDSGITVVLPKASAEIYKLAGGQINVCSGGEDYVTAHPSLSFSDFLRAFDNDIIRVFPRGGELSADADMEAKP